MVKFNLDIDDVLTIKNNQFSSAEKLSKFSLPKETRDNILAINDHDEQVYRYFGTGFRQTSLILNFNPKAVGMK